MSRSAWLLLSGDDAAGHGRTASPGRGIFRGLASGAQGLKMIRASCTIAVTAAMAALATGAALAFQVPAAPELSKTCSAPSEITRLEQSLVRTAARIAQGRPLRIV